MCNRIGKAKVFSHPVLSEGTITTNRFGQSFRNPFAKLGLCGSRDTDATTKLGVGLGAQLMLPFLDAVFAELDGVLLWLHFS